MDILFNINSFDSIVPTIIATVIATAISKGFDIFVKLFATSWAQSSSMHYISQKRISNIFYSLYIILIPTGCIIVFLAIFASLSLITGFCYPLQFNNIISLFNNNIFACAFLIVVSVFIEFIIYKSNILKKVNVKPSFRTLYIFSPTFVLASSLLPDSIFSFVLITILFIIIFLVLLLFQPRTDCLIYNKMDISLNNGMCYLNLNTKNVNFKKNICIIDIFDNTDTDIKKEKILIHVNNIVSRRYYDLDYKIDTYYNFLLKHFPCFFY